jgi:WD40 repeat protein
VRSVVFGPDDRWLAAGSWNLGVQVFDVATGTRLREFGQMHGECLALAPAGDALAVCHEQRDVVLYALDFRPPTADERRRIEALIAQLDDDAKARRDEAAAELLRFGWRAEPLLRQAARASAAAEVRLRCRRLGAELRAAHLAVLTGHDEIAMSAAYSPDGRRLATAGKDGRIVVWDAKSRARAFTLALPE